jgi:rubrerythrin
MSISVEELVSACFDELQLSQRFVPYVQKAEEAGYPQLARLFRALVASETAREALMRKGLVNHAVLSDNYFVFHFDHPEQCPVDQTPGAAFIVII